MAMHLNSDNFNQVISKGKVMVDFGRHGACLVSRCCRLLMN